MIKFDSSAFQKVSAFFRVAPFTQFFDEPVEDDVLKALDQEISVDDELAALLAAA